MPNELRLAVVHMRDAKRGDGAFQAQLERWNERIVRAAAALGWNPFLVPAARVGAQRVVDDALEADLIVIAGGEDVDPRLYAGTSDYESASAHEPRADRTQIAIVHGAMRRSIPILGICRGMQIMNVALGGDLVPHLPHADRHRSTVPGTHRGVHRSIVWEPEYLDPTAFGERSLVEDVIATEPILCTHHQGLGQVARALRVAARAPDGTIEAVVGADAPLTGVQWHPEHAAAPEGQLTRLLGRLAQQREALLTV